MDKNKALKLDELENVSGGVTGGETDNKEKRGEFESAWSSLGLAGIYPGETKKNEQYANWAAGGFTESAYDFLLPMTK